MSVPEPSPLSVPLALTKSVALTLPPQLFGEVALIEPAQDSVPEPDHPRSVTVVNVPCAQLTETGDPPGLGEVSVKVRFWTQWFVSAFDTVKVHE